jgi:hypothetical protein
VGAVARVQLITAALRIRKTFRLVGGVGIAPAKKAKYTGEDALVPLLSVIETTYSWPFVSPVSVQPYDVVVHDSTPGEAVAV